jgi:hypothetical protein
MKNHQERLLGFLSVNKKITSLDAINELGNTRLAATVFELRQKGYDISTTTVTVPTRYGKTNVAEYTLNTHTSTND